MSNGYIRIYRSMLDHWLWREKPFGKGQAWLDLILIAAWKEHQSPRGKTVKRGETHTSQEWLAERWGWTRKEVRGFMMHIEKDGMIITEATKKRGGSGGTKLFVCNFEKFQGCDSPMKPAKGPAKGPATCPQHKKVVKKKGILEENNTALTDAPSLESSQEPSRPIHYPKAKTVVGIWIEANKACGRENVKVTNKDLGFVKKLDALCPDHGELFYCMKAYIDDKDDKYVVNHGHQLYLLLDKFSKYSVLYPKYLAKMAANDVEYGLNGANVTGDSDAIPGESHNAGDYHDGIDDLVAEHEAKENNHAS